MFLWLILCYFLCIFYVISSGQRSNADVSEDRNCRSLCIVVAIFEGSMYVFVSNWTPALQTQETKETKMTVLTAVRRRWQKTEHSWQQWQQCWSSADSFALLQKHSIANSKSIAIAEEQNLYITCNALVASEVLFVLHGAVMCGALHQEIQPPYGLTFALFMMAAMCGSSVARAWPVSVIGN